jgi:glutathione S-transferase
LPALTHVYTVILPLHVSLHNCSPLSYPERFLTCTVRSGITPGESAIKYTVPAIHHVPSNTYMMDSDKIAEFLESTYPEPPLTLTSELGQEVRKRGRAVLGTVLQKSIAPRELRILSPRSEDHFRRPREAMYGCRLEDLLDPEKEDQAWKAASDNIRAVGDLLRTHKAEGPFLLGQRPSYTDFYLAGTLECARVVDEGVFRRLVAFPGFGDIYRACQPFLLKND